MVFFPIRRPWIAWITAFLSPIAWAILPPYIPAMCNDYEQLVTWAQYQAAMDALGLVMSIEKGERDLPRIDDVRINTRAPVMRAGGNGVELTQMNFSFGGRSTDRGPIFNFRSEGRRFRHSQRCVIPASAFFEFTGTKSPKTKHRFTLVDAPFMGIAGIWREEAGPKLSFAMLTVAPGPDIEPYHNRQIAVLRPTDWAAWLHLTKPETEILRPLPAGSLAVETVTERATNIKSLCSIK